MSARRQNMASDKSRAVVAVDYSDTRHEWTTFFAVLQSPLHPPARSQLWQRRPERRSGTIRLPERLLRGAVMNGADRTLLRPAVRGFGGQAGWTEMDEMDKMDGLTRTDTD